ncbi:hypothetical protein [Planctomyces sp. SH-PL62]|uniref:hypothetical protein n=1 Tax=Planctomyces sp. SH-PL62 TaxID=1636152 RepID=UPI00078B5132|nr:hypothetical protein [Planctomyces sp. SH-PL62]AMV36582.1 hypothetical protein VT85_04060 [Planctomyces sp. SH-PL62]
MRKPADFEERGGTSGGPARRRWAGATAWLLAATLGAGGCGEAGGGGEGVAVSGRVSIDGEPVEEGTVTMIPTDADAVVVAAPIKGGAFQTSRADGPRPGKHRVEIRAFAALTGAESAKAKAKAAAGVNTVLFGKDASAFAGAADLGTPRVNTIPARYNTDSKLTADIPAAPAHEVDFDLEK